MGAHEEIAGVFGRAADTYDSVIPYFRTFGERLVEVAGLRPGQRVLDVACGRGAVLLPALAATAPGGTAVGVDLATEMVEALAADLAAAGVEADVRVMDAGALDLPDGSFDAVLSGFTLMLLPDPVAVAREWRRVLRPGGTCAVSQPLGGGERWAFWGELIGKFAPRATKPMPAPPPAVHLGEVLEGAGFVDVRSVEESHRFVFDGPDAWWRWVWSHGMRAFLEVLPPDAQEDLRAEGVRRLVETFGDEIVLDQQVRFVVAAAPEA